MKWSRHDEDLRAGLRWLTAAFPRFILSLCVYHTSSLMLSYDWRIAEHFTREVSPNRIHQNQNQNQNQTDSCNLRLSRPIQSAPDLPQTVLYSTTRDLIEPLYPAKSKTSLPTSSPNETCQPSMNSQEANSNRLRMSTKKKIKRSSTAEVLLIIENPMPREHYKEPTEVTEKDGS